MDAQGGNRLLTAKSLEAICDTIQSGQVRSPEFIAIGTEASVSLDGRLLSKKQSPPLYQFVNPCAMIMWFASIAAIAPGCFAATSAADTA